MDRTSLILRVLSGEATETEKTALNTWIELSKANREEYLDIKLLWENGWATTEIPEGPDDPFYDGLRRIREKMTIISKRQRRKRLSFIATAGVMVAVVILFLVRGGEESKLLKFEDATLEYVVSILERRYELTIAVKDERVLKCRFSGTFYGSTGREAVRSVAENLSLQYETISQDEFRITGKGCIH